MKGAQRRLGWLPMAGLAVLLTAILAFLYVRTQDYDGSNYFENVALLRQLKQLDARWELDVLKSKMGINTNYDSLVDPLVDLNKLRERLQTIVPKQQHAFAGALADGGKAFHQAIQEKTRLIEHFKSHNSVLRNSLAFLPTAAADIQHAANQVRTIEQISLRHLAADANKVLLDSMVYSQSPSDDKAAEMQAELDRLLVARKTLPPAVSESLSIFASHARTVLREQPVVNNLLHRISAVPVAALIDDLDAILSGEQQAGELQAQKDHNYLLIFAVALVGLFLYAAMSLIRSHAVINRMNAKLQEANTSLEQRVSERTRELHEAQSELLATARQAGMAEIASNVLHNVGNVLNSVNVSADLVNSTMRDSRAQGLARAVQLMNEHAADLGEFLTRDPKGKLLPGYLSKLSAALAAEQQGIVEELEAMTNSIGHIKDIVATQQNYAGTSSVLEPVQVKDLLEDALRMNAGGLARHEVTVVKEFAEVPLIKLDKPRLLQIMVNLIANAKQAMDGMTEGAHRLLLRMDVADDAEGRRLRIRVEDDGEGIAPENLPKLFVHGFTTRKHGHGFGLHSCALATKEMGGSLTVRSEGPGKGAIFTLLLPLNTLEATQ